MTTLSKRMAIFQTLSAAAFLGLMTVTNVLSAAPRPEKEPTGLVWFIGTVEQIVDGMPLIDLGEVHTLRQGSYVAIVRYRDSHFMPLGLLEISYSDPTWCQTRKPTSFEPEVGDLVMFVKSPGDLGTGERMQDAFVRHRIVVNSNRNRYSTVRDPIEADTMQRLIEKQPAWVEGDRRVAGTVRSPSVKKDMGTRLKPFITQIISFQDYEDRGIDVGQLTSDAWKVVLDVLRGQKDSADPEAMESAVQVVQESTEAGAQAGNAVFVTVRRLVDQSLFERFPEERNVIAVICAALLRTKTSNERQWTSQQFARTQFPALGNQEQMLVDIEAIMRQVRKIQQGEGQ